MIGTPYERVGVSCEVVTDPAAQRRGLGGRQFLPENEGMLFDFGEAKWSTFVMNGMVFDLDMILVDKGLVKTFVTMRAGDTVTRTQFFGRYVLEVNAGWAAGNSVMSGSPVWIGDAP